MIGVLELAKSSLRDHEGMRLKPFKGVDDKFIIGVGRNLDDEGISMREAEMFLDSDVRAVYDILSKEPYWYKLTGVQQAGMIDLRFAIGEKCLRSMYPLNNALNECRFEDAAAEIESSDLGLTGRRSLDIANMISNR